MFVTIGKTPRPIVPVGKNRGLTLIEVLIAIALLGIIVVGSLGALSTTSKARFIRDERQTAKTLAESQMEYVKKLGYASSYAPAPIPIDYDNYSVIIDTDNISSRDGNIQRIRVIVSQQGRPIIMAENATLEGYKVKR